MLNYLADVNLVDVVGSTVKRRTIEMREGVVTRILRSTPRRTRGARIIDGGEGYALPGLWNVHTHMGSTAPTADEHTETLAARTIRAGQNLQQALSLGVVGIRNVSEPDGIDLAWKEAIGAGRVTGPDVFACGQALVPTGGHYHDVPGQIQADGPWEFRKAVRSQLALGVDQIKLMASGGIATANETYTESQALPDEIEAIVELAHRKGKRVTAHAGGAASVKEVVRAGVDCIEHGYSLDEEAVTLMRERGTYYVPTLFVTQSVESYVGRAEQHAIQKLLAASPGHLASFRMAHAAGLKIAVGADTNPIGPNTFSEIEFMVREGMSTSEALVSATQTSADLCGVGGMSGAVCAGRRADILVVDGNPLEDVSRLRDTRYVFRRGEVVSLGHGSDTLSRARTDHASQALSAAYRQG